MAAAADHLERSPALADDRDAIALGLEVLGDALGEMLFVFDHQNGARLAHDSSSQLSAPAAPSAASGVAAGQAAVKVAPQPGPGEAAVTQPRSSSTKRRTT